MKPLNPSGIATKVEHDHFKLLQSVHKTLTGNIDRGTGIRQNPIAGINKGVYTQFETGNENGVHIRIAANGVTGTGAPYNWGAVNVGIVINHGLLRLPIGFHVVDADKDVRIYRTAAPDASQITLAPTDNTASVTLWIY